MGPDEEIAVPLGSDNTTEYRRTVEVLGKVGLTVYEARAYIALVAQGVGDAAALALAAKIPRTSAYKVPSRSSRRGTRPRPAASPSSSARSPRWMSPSR